MGIVMLVLFVVVMAIWLLSLLGQLGPPSPPGSWLPFFACLILGIAFFLTGFGVVTFRNGP